MLPPVGLRVLWAGPTWGPELYKLTLGHLVRPQQVMRQDNWASAQRALSHTEKRTIFNCSCPFFINPLREARLSTHPPWLHRLASARDSEQGLKLLPLGKPPGREMLAQRREDIQCRLPASWGEASQPTEPVLGGWEKLPEERRGTLGHQGEHAVSAQWFPG